MTAYKAITALVLGALSLTADAGELIVHGVSRHTQFNHDVTTYSTEVRDGITYDLTSTTRAYNNRNFGLGYRTDDGYIFGVYHNSLYNPTVYFGREFMFTRYVGGFLGVATGYDHVVHFPIAPIAGLIVKLPITERVSLEFVGNPKLSSKIDGVVHSMVAYRF